MNETKSKEQIRAELDAWNKKRKANPKRVKSLKLIRKMYGDNIDALCEFAADISTEINELIDENNRISQELARIVWLEKCFTSSPHVPAHVHRITAKSALKSDPDNPSAKVFLAGLTTASRLRAQDNAHKSHAGHRAMRANVFAWLDINREKYPSMTATAEAIANGIAPIKFRTAYSWVVAWKKQSASKL